MQICDDRRVIYAQASTQSPEVSITVEQTVEPSNVFGFKSAIDSYAGMAGGDGIFCFEYVRGTFLSDHRSNERRFGILGFKNNLDVTSETSEL